MNIEELTKIVLKFRNDRDWAQFHNPKDVALSLVLEATEVLEHFQWKNGDAINEYLNDNTEKVAEELSDVLYWILLLSADLKIDLAKAFVAKIEQNSIKYPIDKAKGVSKKYTELE